MDVAESRLRDWLMLCITKLAPIWHVGIKNMNVCIQYFTG